MSRNESALRALKRGDIIFYRLPACLLPTHPEREWRGKVRFVVQSSIGLSGCLVAVLEQGYQDCVEWVSEECITRVERAAAAESERER